MHHKGKRQAHPPRRLATMERSRLIPKLTLLTLTLLIAPTLSGCVGVGESDVSRAASETATLSNSLSLSDGDAFALQQRISTLEQQVQTLETQLHEARDARTRAVSQAARNAAEAWELKQQLSQQRTPLDANWTHLTNNEFSQPVMAYDDSRIILNLVVCTGSMRPTLDCDDAMLGYKPRPEDVREGDILTYLIPKDADECHPHQGNRIIHRVTDVTTNSDGLVFRMQGDANERADPCLVPYDWVETKVLAIVYDSRVHNDVMGTWHENYYKLDWES